MAKGTSLLSSGKVAILAALNIADELFRLRESHEKLRTLASGRISEATKKIDTYVKK